MENVRILENIRSEINFSLVRGLFFQHDNSLLIIQFKTRKVKITAR